MCKGEGGWLQLGKIMGNGGNSISGGETEIHNLVSGYSNIFG